jgi:hypothetical protein
MWGCFYFVMAFHKQGRLLFPRWRDGLLSDSVNRPVACLAWDLLSVKYSTVFLAGGLERKLFVSLFWDGLPVSLVLPAHHLPDGLFAALTEMPQARSGPTNGVHRAWTSGHLVSNSFPSIRLCPGTHSSCTFLRLAGFVTDKWHSQITTVP